MLKVRLVKVDASLAAAEQQLAVCGRDLNYTAVQLKSTLAKHASCENSKADLDSTYRRSRSVNEELTVRVDRCAAAKDAYREELVKCKVNITDLFMFCDGVHKDVETCQRNLTECSSAIKFQKAELETVKLSLTIVKRNCSRDRTEQMAFKSSEVRRIVRCSFFLITV